MYVHGGDSMSNQKEENFKRLAENRTNKIIDTLFVTKQATKKKFRL